MSAEWQAVIPVGAYLGLTFAGAVWAARRRAGQTTSGGFLEEYFIGGRSLGGLALALAIIATYISASSFIGGPGAAYTHGLGWVLLAMIQVPTTFLVLGVLGKRFAVMARRAGALTLSDFLFARYRSTLVVTLCSLALLVFFLAAMTAQFIGGARLFQAVTGHSYGTGLALFGLTVILYTTVGGFRAIAITDAVQGVIMVFVAVFVLCAVVQSGGGMENCVAALKAADPGLITPYGAGGSIPVPMILSFWILVGLGALGLPQTAQKGMAYKDARSMRHGMVAGTVLIGFLLLCIHLAGALGRAALPGLAAGDMIMHSLIMELLPPFWAGVFIAGPLAAVMSTVDSMLLLASAAIVRDLYLRFRHGGDAAHVAPARLKAASTMVTAALGVLVFLAAWQPPDLLVWINLFAFGGLEAAFLWPIILGLYWEKANAAGAIASIVTGVGCFFLLSTLKPPMHGILPIVPTLLLALAAFAAGVFFARHPFSCTSR